MENLKKWLIPLLEQHGCTLYDLEWDRSMKPPVLRVAIDKKDGPVDLDTCALVSDAVSAKLDETDEIQGEYMLEVCSPGAERELRTLDETQAQMGKYVYVKLRNPQDGLNEVTGTLETADENAITIRYFLKGRPKKAVIDTDNIALMTSAVKL